MDFQIHALPADDFAYLFGRSNDELTTYGARRIIANECPGYPCRISLRDALAGETLILTNYTHHDHDSPYRASHAIFVIENAAPAHLKKNRVPDVLRRRLLSVRGFDLNQDMVDADVVDGVELETAVTRLFSNPKTEFIHVHNAKQGCYSAKITKV